MKYKIYKSEIDQLWRVDVTIQRRSNIDGDLHDGMSFTLKFEDLIFFINELENVKKQMLENMLPKNIPYKAITSVLGEH